MGKGGGVMPSLEKFSVPSIPLPRSTSASPRKSGLIWYLIFGVVGAIFLFAIGFFLYPFFIKEDAPASSVAPTRTEEKQLAPTSTAPQTPASFFVNPVTGAVLNIDAATGTPSALIPGVVRAITPEQAFVELMVRKGDGTPVVAREFFLKTAAGIPDTFLTGNFEDYFTAFAFRDRNGIWPGYALKLKGGKLPILLQQDAFAIEDSRSLSNLFWMFPGTPDSGFRDSQIDGNPIRTLSFSSPGATFAYGWFKNYFVFGTSVDALR